MPAGVGSSEGLGITTRREIDGAFPDECKGTWPLLAARQDPFQQAHIDPPTNSDKPLCDFQTPLPQAWL